MPDCIEVNVERFLRCGEYDVDFGWCPGNGFSDRARRANVILRQALFAEIHRRTGSAPAPDSKGQADPALIAITRAKVEPMVRGLFPGHEQASVLDLLQNSVVILSPANIGAVLERTPWLATAWKLANLYLTSSGAKPLGDDGSQIVGFSEESTCYVGMDHERTEGAFGDVIVHEAAHVFHNCRRQTIGLPETARNPWLLLIDFAKRETFAYACEAFSRIRQSGGSRRAREELLAEHARGAMPNDERVDPDEYIDILREAIAARNGWKRILARCAPAPTRGARPDVFGGYRQ